MTVYGSTSIALGPDGTLHIGYRAFSNVSPSYPFLLKYASKTDGLWTVYDVDSEGNAVTMIPTSLAFNSSGVVHLGYSNATDGVITVKLATNGSTGWTCTNVSSSNGVGTMCLDSRDVIHYCFTVRIGIVNALVYSTNEGGSWSTYVIDDQADCWLPTIMADSNGKIHILYSTYGPEWSLHYATNSTGSWETQLVDSSCRYGSMDLDSHDTPWVAYSKDGSEEDDIRLAWLSSGSWSNTTVDTASALADNPCIFVDSIDDIHVSYVIWGDTFSTLMYAHRSGSVWTESIVEHFESDLIPALTWHSMTVDSAGHAHIAYIRALMSGYDDGGGLKYATNSPSTIPELQGFVLVVCAIAMTAIVLTLRNKELQHRRP